MVFGSNAFCGKAPMTPFKLKKRSFRIQIKSFSFIFSFKIIFHALVGYLVGGSTPMFQKTPMGLGPICSQNLTWQDFKNGMCRPLGPLSFKPQQQVTFWHQKKRNDTKKETGKEANHGNFPGKKKQWGTGEFGRNPWSSICLDLDWFFLLGIVWKRNS